jgi:threonine dehydratase
MAAAPITISDVQAASNRVAGAIVETPCVFSHTLSDGAGCDIFIEFENLQFTASRKERGALNKLVSLTDAERQQGVFAMSAGNDAQGVAYLANRLGINASTVMYRGTRHHIRARKISRGPSDC